MRTAAWALALPLLAGCRTGFERMTEQPSWRAYAEVPRLPPGSDVVVPTMRVPPEGTVPRDRPLPDPVLVPPLPPSGASQHRPARGIPVPVTRELLALGRDRYDTICAACHGVLADGKTPVAANMTQRPPPDLLRLRRPPEHVFHVAGHGWGVMPAFGSRLSVTERWAIAGYLVALERSQSTRLEEVPPGIRELLESAPEVTP